MQFLEGGFGGVPTALAVFTRDHGAGLPPVTFDALAAYFPSPVDRTVSVCEALYAAADSLGPEGWTLCAQLARVAQDNGFHELGQTARGAGVIAAMRRRVGETTGPDPSEDPAPLAQYLPPAD